MTPSVRVLFFSVLRERLGAAERTVPLPDPPTGAALLDALERDHPDLTPFRPYLRLAVNRRYVSVGAPLTGGDEVALITPTSGG